MLHILVTISDIHIDHKQLDKYYLTFNPSLVVHQKFMVILSKSIFNKNQNICWSENNPLSKYSSTALYLCGTSTRIQNLNINI